MTIPTNLFMWILALLPIIVLLVLMIGFQWGATEAAPIGLLITAMTGIVFYKADLRLIAAESAKGMWSAVSILLVVWTAILLYQVGEEVKAFLVIRNGMGYSRDVGGHCRDRFSHYVEDHERQRTDDRSAVVFCADGLGSKSRQRRFIRGRLHNCDARDAVFSLQGPASG